MGAGAAGADCCRREAAAAGPADADAGTGGGVPAGHDPSFGGRADQPYVQELLGPAAAGGGDGVQRALGVRAVVGPARGVRAQLLVLLRRGRHRVLGLCARGADAAGVAAAGLRGGDPVRGRDLCTADGVRRAFLHRRRCRGPGELSGDLALLCLDLPLAIDPALGRRKSKPRWRGGAGPATACGSAGAGARWANPIRANMPAAIKRVPVRAKFDIRARKAANDIRHFDRLEAP